MSQELQVVSIVKQAKVNTGELSTAGARLTHRICLKRIWRHIPFMRTIKSSKHMSAAARKIIASGETLALVPTMGFLHEGHLALVDRAHKAADKVVVSIFVNPAQFGPKEDLRSYPRNMGRDLKLLRERGVNLVFAPDVKEMYPAGYATCVEVEKLSRTLEGKFRPGHFRGVTTVVAKLFNICLPDMAVFGQKDYQQAVVLKKLALDLGYPIKIIIGPTLREPNGLALSSRNKYFTRAQREEAACLYRGLSAARRAFRQGERRAANLKNIIRREAKRTCKTVRFDYVALTDYDSLKPLTRATKGAVISLAAKIHGVRLIDNIRL